MGHRYLWNHPTLNPEPLKNLESSTLKVEVPVHVVGVKVDWLCVSGYQYGH